MKPTKFFSPVVVACGLFIALSGPALAKKPETTGLENAQQHANLGVVCSNPGNSPLCSSTSVPEIGAQGAAASLALVLGALALMSSRRRRLA